MGKKTQKPPKAVLVNRLKKLLRIRTPQKKKGKKKKMKIKTIYKYLKRKTK